MFTEAELKKKLQELRNLPSETEWFEFKEANDNFKTDKIGEYFSALSNEANLLEKDSAWFIFGINDKTHNIVGTEYRTDIQRLNSLKQQIAKETTNRISFVEIHELFIENKRVLMFEIPPAPTGIPVAWKGHYYGREHESISALSLEEQDRIRNQQQIEWSARVAERATIDDLDEKAVEYARVKFKEGNERKDFYDNWIILEALNNCIAHQDYSKKEKIIVTEKANYELKFRNSGTFYYGTIEDYIFLEDFTPPSYRNEFLAEAMEKLGMIDTVSKGIKLMFNKQKEKYLPLPEYTLSNYVELTIYADTTSNEYTNQLFENKTLDLGTVFLMDKKQKGFPIDEKDYKYVIISFLSQKKRVGRNDIEELLLPQLDEELDIEQKKKKIANLLYSLSKEKRIRNISKSTKKSIWILS